MTPRIRCSLAVLFSAGLWLAAPAPAQSTAPTPAPTTEEELSQPVPLVTLPAGDELLARVVAHLPTQPLTIHALLQVKRADGALERELRAEVRLEWGAAVPQATYTLRDAFGAPLERLIIRRPPGRPLEYRHFRGEDLRPDPLPSLAAPVQDSEISWADLSFAWLWWPGGRTVGREETRGRLCYQVDLPAPAVDAATCAGVRVWIDCKMPMLWQVAMYDRQQRLLKQLQVKSLKTINKVHMIGDLEVRRADETRRTLLRVQTIE